MFKERGERILTRGREQSALLVEELMSVEGSDEARAFLEQEYRDALTVGRTARVERSEMVFPVISAEHKQKILDALSIFGIFPWEESGLLIVDHKKDIEKIELLKIGKPVIPLTDRRKPTDDVYAFPYPNLKKEENLKREPSLGSSDEMEEYSNEEQPIDEELERIVGDFYAGRVEEDDSVFVSKFGKLPSLALFPRKYVWKEKRLYHSRTGEEISKNELRRMLKSAKTGDEKCTRELLDMNVGLTLFVLARFMDRNQGIDPDDLFQEGLLGLYRAIQTHEPEKGSFTSHAVVNIESRMRRHASRNRYPVRLPVYISAKRKIFRENPDDVQFHEKLKANNKELKHGVLGIERLRRQYLMNAVFSPVDDMPESDLMRALNVSDATDMFTDNEGFDEVEYESFKKLIDEALKEISIRRDEEAVRLYFGIGSINSERETLESIANRYGVTRESIRQRIIRALRGLRHPSRSKQLATYMHGPVK